MTSAVLVVLSGVMTYYLRENAVMMRAVYDHLAAVPSPPPPPHAGSAQSTVFYPAPAKRQMRVNGDNMLFDSERLPFAVVTDLDHASRDPELFLWKSHMKGELLFAGTRLVTGWGGCEQ